jgi:hypothetical protein
MAQVRGCQSNVMWLRSGPMPNLASTSSQMSRYLDREEREDVLYLQQPLTIYSNYNWITIPMLQI